MKTILLTSNESKLKEFKEYIPDILKANGKDIKEVDGNIEEVILYKALDSRIENNIEDSLIVEDTILIVNGKEVVDIRWKLDELKEGDEAIWITSFGLNDGDTIKIFQSKIEGTITKSRGNEGFAFDPYFIPKGSNKTLAELDKKGKKGDFSARKNALLNYKNNNILKEVKIKDIPKWNGKYQNEN